MRARCNGFCAEVASFEVLNARFRRYFDGRFLDGKWLDRKPDPESDETLNLDIPGVDSADCWEAICLLLLRDSVVADPDDGAVRATALLWISEICVAADFLGDRGVASLALTPLLARSTFADVGVETLIMLALADSGEAGAASSPEAATQATELFLAVGAAIEGYKPPLPELLAPFVEQLECETAWRLVDLWELWLYGRNLDYLAYFDGRRDLRLINLLRQRSPGTTIRLDPAAVLENVRQKYDTKGLLQGRSAFGAILAGSALVDSMLVGNWDCGDIDIWVNGIEASLIQRGNGLEYATGAFALIPIVESLLGVNGRFSIKEMCLSQTSGYPASLTVEFGEDCDEYAFKGAEVDSTCRNRKILQIIGKDGVEHIVPDPGVRWAFGVLADFDLDCLRAFYDLQNDELFIHVSALRVWLGGPMDYVPPPGFKHVPIASRVVKYLDRGFRFTGISAAIMSAMRDDVDARWLELADPTSLRIIREHVSKIILERPSAGPLMLHETEACDTSDVVLDVARIKGLMRRSDFELRLKVDVDDCTLEYYDVVNPLFDNMVCKLQQDFLESRENWKLLDDHPDTELRLQMHVKRGPGSEEERALEHSNFESLPAEAWVKVRVRMHFTVILDKTSGTSSLRLRLWLIFCGLEKSRVQLDSSGPQKRRREFASADC